jgi:hypothetical protein
MGVKAWCQIIREGQRLKVFRNRVLKGIFGRKVMK